METQTIKRVVNGAAAVTLPPCSRIWAYPIVSGAYHYAYAFIRESNEHDATLRTRDTGPRDPLVQARFEPTDPGWHRIGIHPKDGGARVTATYENAVLKAPEAARIRGDNCWYFWLERYTETPGISEARDLARHFILDWNDTPFAEDLNKRRRWNDPYPELSQLGLDNEWLLCQLTTEPESLDGDDLDNLEDVGREVHRLLYPDSETD